MHNCKSNRSKKMRVGNHSDGIVRILMPLSMNVNINTGQLRRAASDQCKEDNQA